MNFWGGDYLDWMNPRTKDAASMKKMLEEKITSPAQLVDQYEQLEEKFIRGKYGCIFMYTGSLNTFRDANVYGKTKFTWHLSRSFRKKQRILLHGSMF